MNQSRSRLLKLLLIKSTRRDDFDDTGSCSTSVFFSCSSNSLGSEKMTEKLKIDRNRENLTRFLFTSLMTNTLKGVDREQVQEPSLVSNTLLIVLIHV